MATHKGQDGAVKVGNDVVGESASWDVTQDAPTQDATSQRDAWQKHETFAPGWTGNMTLRYDPADAGQNALTIGAQVGLDLYPINQLSGSKYYQGNATITSRTETSPFDGVVEVAIAFQGNGALSEQTVTP